MTSDLCTKTAQPLEAYLAETVYKLNAVHFCKVKEGQQFVDGTAYIVTNTETGDKISVVITDREPYIRQEILDTLLINDIHIFVEFENATVLPFYSFGARSIEDDIRATGIRLVEIA